MASPGTAKKRLPAVGISLLLCLRLTLNCNCWTELELLYDWRFTTSQSVCLGAKPLEACDLRFFPPPESLTVILLMHHPH
jgi:hypothetical protein